MKSEIKCKHYKGDGYDYDISDDEILLLCEQCHLNLAGELAKQVFTEALVKPIVKDDKR